MVTPSKLHIVAEDFVEKSPARQVIKRFRDPQCPTVMFQLWDPSKLAGKRMLDGSISGLVEINNVLGGPFGEFDVALEFARGDYAASFFRPLVEAAALPV